MADRTFVAEYRWDDRAWIVQFRDPDIATFGRTLASAKRYARDALAVYFELPDLDDAGIEVIDDVRLPDKIAVVVEQLTEDRDRAESLRSKVAESTRSTVANLRRLGFSTRDVGEILGISGARVAQIDREGGSG